MVPSWEWLKRLVFNWMSCAVKCDNYITCHHQSWKCSIVNNDNYISSLSFTEHRGTAQPGEVWSGAEVVPDRRLDRVQARPVDATAALLQPAVSQLDDEAPDAQVARAPGPDDVRVSSHSRYKTNGNDPDGRREGRTSPRGQFYLIRLFYFRQKPLPMYRILSST